MPYSFCSARKANKNAHDTFDSDIIKSRLKTALRSCAVRLAGVGNRSHRGLTAAVGISFALNRADKWHGHTTLETWPVRRFIAVHGRSPTPKEWSLLWHCPARVDKPNAEERDYAQRFANLYERKSP